MEIFESQKHSEWVQFRNIAIEILNHAQKLKLPLKLDNLTFGNFNVAKLVGKDVWRKG